MWSTAHGRRALSNLRRLTPERLAILDKFNCKHFMEKPEKIPAIGTVIQEVNNEEIERRGGPQLPPFFPGDWVSLAYYNNHAAMETEKPIRLNGLVLGIRRKGLHSSFIVRGQAQPKERTAVEIQFPFYCPWIVDFRYVLFYSNARSSNPVLRVIKSYPVKSAKLLYMRGRKGFFVPYGKPPKDSAYVTHEDKLKEMEERARKGPAKKARRSREEWIDKKRRKAPVREKARELRRSMRLRKKGKKFAMKKRASKAQHKSD